MRPPFDKSVGSSWAAVKAMTPAKKMVVTNRRPASSLNPVTHFERAACDPPFLSAVVAHLCR